MGQQRSEVQATYEECLANGCSPRLAEMLALQAPPMSNTDREFMEGRVNGNQFEGQDHIGDYYASQSNVDKKGKYYLSQLANFPGDPEAWVSGKGDVRAVCEKRGWGCPDLGIKAQEPVEEHKSQDVDDRLIQSEVNSIFDAMGPDAGKRLEVIEKVRSKRKRSK